MKEPEKQPPPPVSQEEADIAELTDAKDCPFASTRTSDNED